ncbi:hypothetical protein LCGC14_2000770 [marine sediment metagenome]|uniref:Uncharacterized protein n=1 Tax=marine sediment metagenome TaxID=412755 RepID=A0A0F9F373_9ZZZZ
MKAVQHKCPPHHFIINPENVGRCIYCPKLRDFGELLRRDGVFVVAGRRGAEARGETSGKKRGRKKKQDRV